MKKFYLAFVAALLSSLTLSATDYTDVIDTSTGNIFGSSTKNSYAAYSYTANGTGESGVSYSGWLARNNTSGTIALQYNNSSSRYCGIVTTNNPNNYTLKSVTLKWSTTSSNANALGFTVYGATSNYNSVSSATSLKSLTDTSIGNINISSNASLTAPEGLTAMSIRPQKAGALYLSSITIVWTDDNGEDGEDAKTTATLQWSANEASTTMGGVI